MFDTDEMFAFLLDGRPMLEHKLLKIIYYENIKKNCRDYYSHRTSCYRSN